MHQPSFDFSTWFQLKDRSRETSDIIMPVKYVVLKFRFGPGVGGEVAGLWPPSPFGALMLE